MSIKLHIIPNSTAQYPERGGVREHLIQFRLQALNHNNIRLVDNIDEADVVHVESTWPIPSHTNKPVVYVCHGGFVPQPLPVVIGNLKRATRIVTVADWMVGFFFPQFRDKTIHIPNGVVIEQFEQYKFKKNEGYFLYAKEWPYYFPAFAQTVMALPNLRFKTTIWDNTIAQKPDNVEVIGLKNHDGIAEILSHATALLLTGSEVCPTMLLEAWACGVPVVARQMHGSMEIMLNGDGVIGGKLASVPHDFRWAVEDMYHYPASRDRLGKQGYAHVVQHYQWVDLFERYVNLYKELLNVG